MKALLIGGTGRISMAITRKLVRDGWDVTLLNRGNRKEDIPSGAKLLTVDINEEEQVASLMEGKYYDCVCEFIGFTRDQVRGTTGFSRDT